MSKMVSVLNLIGDIDDAIFLNQSETEYKWGKVSQFQIIFGMDHCFTTH